VALSTGNVYPFTSIDDGGSRESDPLTPLGEYPNAAVGRERIFEFCSARHGTRIALLRLYYAVELRYGVLVDIGSKVADGKPIDLTNGAFNCIWQGDANERVLRALALTCTPPSVWNLCRPELISTRDTALRFGALLGRSPIFQGTESDTALLGDGSKLCCALGEPSVTVERMMRWIAHWIRQGGRNLNLPTHFEVRDGVY
jgi:nucleoside-diphosphate-sugar epimerase